MRKTIILLGFILLFFGQIKAQKVEKIVFSKVGWKLNQCLVMNPPCSWRGEIPSLLPPNDRKCWIALDCPGCGNLALCAGNLLVRDIPDFEVYLQLFDPKSKTYKDLVKGLSVGKDKVLNIDKDYDAKNLSFFINASKPLKKDRILKVEYVK